MRHRARALLALLLLLGVPDASTSSQNPSAGSRATLNQYLADLLKNPHDQALRETIIRLAVNLQPPPSLPPEAERTFVRAVTFQKEATTSAMYEEAIANYKQALLLAPWWSDAYYNLSKAQEAIRQFDAAIKSLRLYLLTRPSDTDAREAQLQIYALEAKQEIAHETGSRQAAPARAPKQETPGVDLSGTWTYQQGSGWIVTFAMVGTDEFVMYTRNEDAPPPYDKTNEKLRAKLVGRSFFGTDLMYRSEAKGLISEDNTTIEYSVYRPDQGGWNHVIVRKR